MGWTGKDKEDESVNKMAQEEDAEEKEANGGGDEMNVMDEWEV